LAEEDEDAKIRKTMEKRLKALELEKQKRELVRRYMDPAAYERLMNVRVANYQLYSQILDLIISSAQSGRLGRITDEQLKSILMKLTSRPEPKIEFRHK